MPHIHTANGHHDSTVSFFIVREDFDEPKLILHTHRKTGRLSMFGGHVELNETPWQAALHEITEETGYLHSQLRILQPPLRIKSLTDAAVHPQPVLHSTGQYPVEPVHFHTDIMYALTASEEPELSPEDGESTDIRLFTLAELKEISQDEIFEAWREVGIYILTEIHRNWQPEVLDSFEAETVYNGLDD